MADELKACPFCGQAALSKVDNDEWEIARVECINQACRASGPHVNLGDFCSFDEAEAAGIEAWNTRPLTGGVTEEMVEAGVSFVCGAYHTFGKTLDGKVSMDVLRQDLAGLYLAMSNASRGVK